MSTAIAHHSDPPGTSGFDDPFHDPVVIGIGIAFVIVGIVILALTGLRPGGTSFSGMRTTSGARWRVPSVTQAKRGTPRRERSRVMAAHKSLLVRILALSLLRVQGPAHTDAAWRSAA